MATRFPVVTGLGIVTAIGCGVDEVWGSIARGQSGLRPLTLFKSPRYGQILAGEIHRDLHELGASSHGSRSDRLAWLAARDAISSSGIDLQRSGDRTGLLLGTSVGGSFDSERFLARLIKEGKMRPRPTRFHECVSGVDLIADDFGLFGPSMAIATACSSGALAIATAAELIVAGEADVMLAGGADSLSRMTWGGFHSLLLVDSMGCRPFDANRAGMSLGEGSAMLVLEAEETARARGAQILARLAGWGGSCDAHHATAPHPEGEGALAAMKSAVRRAGIEPFAWVINQSLAPLPVRDPVLRARQRQEAKYIREVEDELAGRVVLVSWQKEPPAGAERLQALVGGDARGPVQIQVLGLGCPKSDAGRISP